MFAFIVAVILGMIAGVLIVGGSRDGDFGLVFVGMLLLIVAMLSGFWLPATF